MAVDGLRQALSDRYNVERELGRGGMATVYLATDLKVGRSVAIKVLHPELGAALGGERFHREIQIASRLTHPNILPVYDSGEADGTLYYVMPFVEGESLRERLDRERQLGIDDAIRVTCQIASALEYAHRAGIVHRDIKPENILIAAGQAVLADFGIARAVTSAADVEALTRTGMSLGTPAYMSPEQAMGERNLDGRSDQYALACVAYEMLAGQPPFSAPTMQAMIARHIAEQVPLITTVRSAVPDEVQDVILQALEKVPADRFPTIGQFAEALAGAGSMTMTGTTRRTTPPRAMRYTTRTNRVAQRPPSRFRQAAIGAALAIPLLAGGAFSAQRLFFGDRHLAAAAGDVAGNRLAVLYFADDSKTGELRYLADGLTESLIEQLSQVAALDVVSTNAVLPFRGKDLPADSISRVLAAGTVPVGSIVKGSVEPTQRGVRVGVRLVDGVSGDDIDRASFELASSDLGKATGELAARVAEFLRSRIGREIVLRERKHASSNVLSWTLVQRAEKRRKDADSLIAAGATEPAVRALAEADSMLARADALDPKWSEPQMLRAAIALAKVEALKHDPRRLPAIIDSGVAHADGALALDPRNADALEYKGKLLYSRITNRLIADPAQSERTIALAESTLARAVGINKNQAGAWDALSALHYRKPDLQAVINAALRAYDSDAYLRSARSILIRLFLASYNLEYFPEATKWLGKIEERFPNDRYVAEGHLLMYRTKYTRPDIDSAWTYARQYVERTPERDRDLGRRKAQMHVAGALATAGLADSARRVLLRARAPSAALDPARELSAVEAAIRVTLGDHDEAVQLLKDYLTVNPHHRKGFATHTMWWWRGLQDNPKFKALISGLP
jgi:TolB-like protein/tRNA A-37 threonylcarbamoyl transferase component Bud32